MFLFYFFFFVYYAQTKTYEILIEPYFIVCLTSCGYKLQAQVAFRSLQADAPRSKRAILLALWLKYGFIYGLYLPDYTGLYSVQRVNLLIIRRVIVLCYHTQWRLSRQPAVLYSRSYCVLGLSVLKFKHCTATKTLLRICVVITFL